MKLRLPWVSRALADQLERQIAYRDTVIDKIRKERDTAMEQRDRATDDLIMHLGARPISAPVRAESAKRDEEAEKEARLLAEAFAEIDAETRLITENLSDEPSTAQSDVN